jgi:acyl carrier protein
MNTKAILKNYIEDQLMKGSMSGVDDNENLLVSGIIDSLGVLQLISFIEERFNIEVPDEDVTIDNFQSVQSISDYLANGSN